MGEMSPTSMVDVADMISKQQQTFLVVSLEGMRSAQYFARVTTHGNLPMNNTTCNSRFSAHESLIVVCRLPTPGNSGACKLYVAGNKRRT
jgi:hypothetical protein